MVIRAVRGADEPAVTAPQGDVALTKRGRQTRARLVDAATEEFAERQYLATNVATIVERAGVSRGTFYTYFDSKQDIFREVAIELKRTMLAVPRSEASGTHVSLLARVERANRAYLATYREHARLFAALEQVATFNDELRAIRREVRHDFVARAERVIAKYQREGMAHQDVDPRYAASALGSMVDRFAYVWLVLGEDFDFEESVYSLTLLWARALGIDVPEGTLPRVSS
jgi:AcrR family transcriptional regulator